MDPHRKSWNQGQQALRSALSHPNDHAKAVELFLSQHGMLHSSRIAPPVMYSFDDELWQGLPPAAARRIPAKGEHSIAWMIWHMARIEDMTMNVLLAGGRQVLDNESWLERVKVAACDTGNTMDVQEIAKLSTQIDVEALRDYRLAVGSRTREIVTNLQPGDAKRKVEPRRLQQLKDEGAVLDGADWLIKYWAGLTVAGLLLMPPTRHNFVHLNEAIAVKHKVMKA